MRIGPIASVFAATLFYAIQNVVLDKHLRELSPLAMSGIITGLTALLSWVSIMIFAARGVPISFPAGPAIGWALLCGVLVFLAEISYFNAYASGNTSAVAITTVVTLMPVFVALIKWIIGDGYPSGREILAVILALSAVLLLATK